MTAVAARPSAQETGDTVPISQTVPLTGGSAVKPPAPLAVREAIQPAPLAPVSLLPSAGEWQTMIEMADALHKSGLLPAHIRTWQSALAVIQKGRELGVPPMHALSNIYVIDGKPAANAELIAGLILRDHGDDALIVEHTDNECATIRYRRRSWAAHRSHSFTIRDAEKAGLYPPTKPASAWGKYTANMLRARAISAVGHMQFQDSIGGLYTPEELGAIVSGETGDVITLPDPEPIRGSKPSGGADETVAEFRQKAASQGRKPAAETVSPRQRVSRDDVVQALVERFGMVSDLDRDPAEVAGLTLESVTDELPTAQIVAACRKLRAVIADQYHQMAQAATAAGVSFTDLYGVGTDPQAMLANADVRAMYEEAMRLGFAVEQRAEDALPPADQIAANALESPL